MHINSTHTHMHGGPTCTSTRTQTWKRRGPGAQRRLCGSTVLHVVYAARDPVEERRGARCWFSIFTTGGRGPAENTKGHRGMSLACTVTEPPKISPSVCYLYFLWKQMYSWCPYICEKTMSLHLCPYIIITLDHQYQSVSIICCYCCYNSLNNLVADVKWY